MNGNMLLVYSVLKNHFDGLYKEELEIIETIKEPRLKKILFVLLVWPKVYEKFKSYFSY